MVPRLPGLETIKRYLPLPILLLHAALAFRSAVSLSPVWDEILWPRIGVQAWTTGSLAHTMKQPPLAMLISALPLLRHSLTLPTPAPGEPADEFHQGFTFTYHNVVPSQRIIFLSRLAMMTTSLFTALLLWAWTRRIWGPDGATISLLCYVTTPLLVSRASLALLEMPTFFFVLLSLAFYERTERQERWFPRVTSGAAAGAALACKMIALPWVGAVIVLSIWDRNWKGFALWLGGLVGMTLAIYAPWSGGMTALGDAIRLLANVHEGMPAYFYKGIQYAHPPAILTGAALGVKAPIFVVTLAVWGGFCARQFPERRTVLRLLLVFIAMYLLPVLLYKRAMSTVQLAPLYLGLAALAGSLAYDVTDWRAPRQWILALLMVGATFEIVHASPDPLSYFNAFAGGSRAGHRWLSDSDQEWGQSLAALAAYQKERGSPHILLMYSGAADPRAYGLSFQDLYSPALYVRETQGDPIPNDGHSVWIALSTKVLQSEPDACAWLTKNIQSFGMVGNGFLLYDVTRHPMVFHWAAGLYNETKRPAMAAWAKARAASMIRP